jgi:hypothetical protein
LKAGGVLFFFPAGYQEIASAMPQTHLIENQLIMFNLEEGTVRFRSIGCPVLGWESGGWGSGGFFEAGH